MPSQDRALFRTILTAVDFSKNSRRALRYAAGLAESNGARLTVLFVSDPLLVAASVSVYKTEAKFLDRTRTELVQFVERALVGSGLDMGRVECLAVGGDAPREIASVAAKHRVDLIVLGTEGLGGIRKLFFGSTTAQVLALATVPVLAVPPHAKRPRAAIGLAWPTNRMLAPIELTTAGAKDVARVADIARRSDAALTLLHVVMPLAAPPWAQFKAAEYDRKRVTAARERLRALAAKAGGIRPTIVVLVGNPAREIAGFAARRKTGLLVLTARKGEGVFGHRPGSIAYQAVRRASSPVLVLPKRAGPTR